MFLEVVLSIVSLFLIYFVIRYNKSSKCESLKNKHVVITGGSSGIGKAFAILVARKGADVTIIARNKGNLELAVKEIKQNIVDTNQQIESLSLDVTNYVEVQRNLSQISSIDMLVNCAGMAICGKLENTSVEDFRHMMNLNYLGTVYVIKTVIPKMQERNSGKIIIVGSQGSLVGIFGMAAYTASKFALRGLAESLDMELTSYNIDVTFAVPPDTDTPGFANENKSKPIETSLICESGGLFKPEVIAQKLFDDSTRGRFFSYVGFESYLTTTLCVGMARASSFFEIVSQLFVLGTFRIISYFYLLYFHKIIRREAVNSNKNK